MRYVTYLAKNIDNGLYYIGYKSFLHWEEFNSYNTSSKNRKFKKGTIMKCVLAEHESRDEAIDEERRLQIENDVLNNPKYANLAICSPGTKIIVDPVHQSKSMRKLWSNSLYREQMKISREGCKEILRDRMVKRWSDEKFREEMSSKRRYQTSLQIEACKENLKKGHSLSSRAKARTTTSLSKNPLNKKMFSLVNIETGGGDSKIWL